MELSCSTLKEEIFMFSRLKSKILEIKSPPKTFFKHNNIFLIFLKPYNFFSSVTDIHLENSFWPIHDFERNGDAKQKFIKALYYAHKLVYKVPAKFPEFVFCMFSTHV